MKLRVLTILRCPYCRTLLKPTAILDTQPSAGNSRDADIRFGIVSCRCNSYPIIQSILCMKANNLSAALEYVKTGAFPQAVDAVLDLPKGVSRIIKIIKPGGPADRITRAVGYSTDSLFAHTDIPLASMRLVPAYSPWIRYLQKRHSNPTFYHSLAQISLFRRGYTADIGAGLGHFIQEVSSVQPAASVIGVDNSFWNLYFTLWKNPGCSYICCDAQDGLPFSTGSITNLTFNDCLHCISNRRLLLKDSIRVLTSQGVAAFCHVHNTAEQGRFVGDPIPIGSLLKQIPSRYVYALSEKTLHQKVILEGAMLPLTSHKISTRSNQFNQLRRTPSYVLFAFRTAARNRLLSLPAQFAYFKATGLDYSEDTWLTGN